jgi:hypothetical protein
VDSGGVSLSGQVTGSFTTGVGAYVGGGVQYGTGPTFGNNPVNVGVKQRAR